MRSYVVAAFLTVSCIGSVAAAQDPAPTSAPSSRRASPPKKPLYDEKADARAELTAAIGRAKADRKRVLVVLGFNACGWCVKLDDLCKKDAKIAKTLRYEYEVVKIDTSRFAAAADLVPGADEGAKKGGYPYLAVLDTEGKVVALQETGSLEVDGNRHDPAKVLAFFTEKQAPALDADVVLKEAVDRATSEGKLVFVHLGAPWCGWCHKLEAFFARPEIAAVVGLDYVRVKIDVDRMTNGKAVEQRFRKDAKGGIPWFWFMKPTGEILAVSDTKDGNIGHPYKPEEVAHFMAMVKKTSKKATAEQWKAVEAALLRQQADEAKPAKRED